MAEHQIRIALSGIVQLLSRNLYSSTDAFVRELLQNAHDSIVRRRVGEPGHGGRVRILPDPVAHRVTFVDDGVGLTAEEIHDYLSTIGRSGTGELRASLAKGGAAAAQLIGQFGIGLLSAFLVADRVDVHTRALGSDRAWRWHFDGGATYELVPGDRAEVGTSVTLHLAEAHRSYARTERLRSLVRRYADLLDVPIVVGVTESVANAQRAPWDYDGAEDEAYRSFFRRRFPEHGAPLLVVPIADDALQLHGVVGVPARSLGLAAGRVDLYVRRMYITGSQDGLLPPWASFFDGVLCCDTLTPAASRDAVLRDDRLAAVQQAVAEQVVGGLQRLAHEAPGRLRGVMRLHSTALLGLCVRYDELFEALADLLPLRTSQGPRTLPEVAADDGRVYGVSRRDGSEPLRALAAARGVPLLMLWEPYAQAFVERYAACWPTRCRLVRLDLDGPSQLLVPVTPEEQLALGPLATHARRLVDEDVVLARFAPAQLPAVRLDTPRGRARRQLGELEEDVGLPDFLAGAVADVAELDEGSEAVIHLNVGSPLVAELATRLAEGPDSVAERVLAAVLAQARWLGTAATGDEERLALAATMSAGLAAALGVAEEVTDGVVG